VKRVLDHLKRLVAVEESRNQPDLELLRRFVEKKDEAAFCALLERHGPMVLGVCRRVLRNEQDAEDALQATFLVFVRKAVSIRRGTSVRSWLYGVAYRISRKACAKFSRQRVGEQRAAESARPEATADPTWAEMQTVLDEELQSLPEKYRLPILLCCLEGKSRDEAAKELGWKEGAVKIRLERGRKLLRQRLAKRGLPFSAVLLGTLLAKDAIAATLPVRLVAGLVDAGMKYAAGQSLSGLVSATVVGMANGMLQTLAIAKVKIVSAVLFIVGAIGLGIGTVGHGMLSAGTTSEDRRAGSNHRTATDLPAIPEIPAIQMPLLESGVPNEDKADGAKERGPTVLGTVRAVHDNGQTLTLRVKEREHNYSVEPTARVLIDGKHARAVDLKPRYRVTVTLTKDGMTIAEIAAAGPVVSGSVVSVNPVQQTVTVAWKEDARAVNRTFSLAPNTSIVVDEVSASLADVAVGSVAEMQFDVDEKTLLKLVARSR